MYGQSATAHLEQWTIQEIVAKEGTKGCVWIMYGACRRLNDKAPCKIAGVYLEATWTSQTISESIHDTAVIGSQSTVVKMNDICSYGVSLGIKAVLCKQWALDDLSRRRC